MARVAAIFALALSLCPQQCQGATAAKGHRHPDRHLRGQRSGPFSIQDLVDAKQQRHRAPSRPQVAQHHRHHAPSRLRVPSFDDSQPPHIANTRKTLEEVDAYVNNMLSTDLVSSQATPLDEVHEINDEPPHIGNTVEKLEEVDAYVHNMLRTDLVSKANPLEKLRKANPLEKLGNAHRQIRGKKNPEQDEGKLQRELREQKAKQAVTAAGHKPVMGRINMLRTQMCWMRPNLWQHEKCLRFLGLHCLEGSTGAGICHQFTQQAKAKCEDPDANADFKTDYCALSEALGEEEEEEEVVAEKEQQVAENSTSVGSDEDLEHELENKDKDLEHSEEQGEQTTTEPKREDLEHSEEQGEQTTTEPKREEDVTPVEDQVKSDRDGDGVPDDADAFPDDPKEWHDADGDGVGDNADTDLDNDGSNNDVDAFPTDPKEQKDTDADGIGDNADKDRDNDGVEDDKDTFPDDPTEWKDTDGDGVGDNKDAYPLNPNCFKDGPCGDIEDYKMPKPQSSEDPSTLDMDAHRPLPDQGFSEHMAGPPVSHDNFYSWTGDWTEEFPEMASSEHDTLSSICKEHPNNKWCKRLGHQDANFR